MAYRCTKTYGHDLGLSATFRQWRADSHCHFLHGYALAFSATFEADTLDKNGWVLDFGGLKEFKQGLTNVFDHKTVVAADDPQLPWFKEGERAGCLELVVVERTGCEGFAALVAKWLAGWLDHAGHSPRVRLVEVTVREHGANSATVVL
jgi:6-pyruvoyltetrahydropterin/6-carboxytetrahydropterin synthase